jgi:molybdopterin synthase catalytic subunit
MKKITLQNEPIDIALVMNEAGSDSDGAVVSFIGRARNNSNGKPVLYLEYEAYSEMARKQLQKVIDDAAARWALGSCILVHRTGRVDVGEASIIIAASSPHRQEAFQAVQFIIDTIKAHIPIWKKEFYPDGSSWINGKK